ncbi:60S ribosomal protein L27a/L28 [Pisolithus thermaeus]|nr:60S ribosomal protein L27a/L28 [Pisolithus thermaeus]
MGHYCHIGPTTPGYFGKVGMCQYNLMHNASWQLITNFDKLWILMPEEEKQGLMEDLEIVPMIDTLWHGYGKVLGNRQLPKLPFTVQAQFVLKRAEDKIKEAGGVVKLIA